MILEGLARRMKGSIPANTPKITEIQNLLKPSHTPNCPSRGEIPKILKLAWGKAFVEVVAMRRLACV